MIPEDADIAGGLEVAQLVITAGAAWAQVRSLAKKAAVRRSVAASDVYSLVDAMRTHPQAVGMLTQSMRIRCVRNFLHKAGSVVGLHIHQFSLQLCLGFPLLIGAHMHASRGISRRHDPAFARQKCAFLQVTAATRIAHIRC